MMRLAGFAARLLPHRLRAWVYRLGPASKAMRSFLTWIAPEGLIEVEVAAGPLRGKRFALDLQREKDLWLGNYETQVARTIAKLVQPGATIYDVGAHIGYHSIYFADRVGQKGKVFAFEPHPENLDPLMRLAGKPASWNFCCMPHKPWGSLRAH
jgi:hypothetical protein